MKTTYTTIVQFSLILLSILISSNLVIGQDSEREIQRQTYERSLLGQFQNTNFKDIPWMMIFSDGRLSYPEIKKLFEQKVVGIDLVVEDRKLHKKWHIYKNMMEARQYADGKFHFQDDRLAAIRKYESAKALEKSSAANFQFVGQDSSVLYTNNGRIERVNFHPSNPNIIWASAPEGGLWRSNDAGSTWNIIDENWEHLSVGDLVYNTHDNDTIYVATDDHDSWFNENRGVLRSDDGGVTWAVVGLPNSQATNVYKLMMHPDGRTLYACTSQGLFTSSDHGVTWIHNTALPIHVNDLEFHPTNPMIIYATTRATYIPSTFDYFFVSTNGGATFSQITAPIDAIAATTQVTVSPNNPDIAYIAAYPGGQTDPKQGGKVMKYTQSTNTITIVTPVTYTFPMPYWSLAGAWDFRIEVDPNDANHLIHGCVWTHESFDGGATWNLMSVPHADVHDIKWQTGTNRLWVAEDGGLSYTEDTGASWTTMRKLPVMQWYSINSSKYGTVKLMGAQDAGVHVDYDGHWFRPGGGDGLEVKVDPVDSTLMYGTVQQGLDLYQIRYDPNTQTYAHVGLINQTSGGGQATWRQEVLIDAADRNILYTNYLDIFKSTDRGATWTNITNGNLGNNGAQITYIYQAKSNPNILITGWGNEMKKSTDAGVSWNSITHPGIYLSDQTQMVIHPSNPDLMWACGSGRVRKTTDGGSTWTEYTGTLSPALGIGTTIAYQDGTNDLLYVGGKYGNIYYRDNTMSDWAMYRTNMPNVWVQEIEVLPLIDKMRVATWGRGVWESPTATPSMMPCNEPAPPSISVQQCGSSADLTIAVAPSGYTIAWYKDDVVINGETSTMLSITMNGVYKARYLETTGTCHSYMSEAVNINFNAAVTLNTGRGINLDGTDDYISTTNGAIDLSGKSFSVEFWAKAATSGNAGYMIGQGGTGTNSSLHVGFRSSGAFTFAFYGNDLDADAKYKDQNWHHWACVYDKSIADPAHNRFIYRDGVLVASDRSTSDFLGSGMLNIGTQLGTYFNGTLDDIKIWYKALSQTEVQTNAYCPLTCYDENLALYVPINEGTANADNTGLTITDYSVNSHTLSLNNLTLNGTTSNIVSGLNILRYTDADMDGYGDPNNSTSDLCTSGNYSFIAGDCDDSDANIKPYATEICGNSKDDNCDGNTDQEVNKGLHFDGSGHKISIPNIVYGTNFSYETWVKVEEADQGTTYNLIQWGGGSTTATFAVHSGGGLAYFEGGGFSFGTDVVDGQWHHLVIVREGINIRVFSDGIQRFHRTDMNNTIANTYINIGDGFKGQMDDLRYWDVALTAAQIQERMNLRLDGDETNLIRYYPLDHGVPNMDNSLYTIAKDWTSNTADGTLVGFGLTGTTSNWVTTKSYPTLYLDDDADGFGSSTTWTCGSMDDYVENSLDCDDSDANINPLASEICGNSKDDNCDGLTDADDNTALNFDDATSNFLSIPVVDYTDDFAVEYWFKSETNSGGIKNIVRYQGATENWELGIWDNELGFLTNNNGWRFGGTVNDGQWHHLVMNYRTSDDNVKIYLDGQLKLQVGRNMDFEATAMAIGSDTGSGRKWKGTLDEFRIWDRLLTDVEIADPELIPLEGNESGLLRYYPFDQGVASANNAGVTTVKDGHTAAQHGTMTGFTLTGNTSNWVAGENYTPLYFDEDQDGFGGTTLWTCGSTTNYTLDNLDTNDNDNTIHPGALDICGNGMDENGNGVNDENTLSLKLDGSDDYVDLGNTLGNFGTGDFTIEARFKTTGTRDAIISKRDECSCDNFWNILVDTGGEMTFEIYNESNGGCANGTTLISTTLVNDGNWHHVAVTRKNSVVRLFVDGVQEKMGTATADINTTYPLEIGKSICDFDNFFLNGEIDEVRLWNYARGSSSIAAFKDAVVPASMTGLLAYYDFNNPSAASGQDNAGQTTLTDRTGNHNGTLNNFALNGTSSNWVGNPEVTKTWYADTDMDGYGDANVTQVACAQPTGYVDNDEDCNDNDGNINPAADEISGNSIDDDCDGATDESSSIKWVLQSSNSGSCTDNTDCCTQTFCYGLELTPANSGTITSYTTGFFIDCVGGNSPIISNTSCTMDDSSNAIDGCAAVGQVLFNSSGNNGNLTVTAGVPVILHQVCFSVADKSTLNITEDEITNITISNQGTTSFNNEFPAFTTQSISGNQEPELTAGSIDACYTTLAAAEAAAIAATTATDDCGGTVNLTASTTGTCSAVITVTGTDQCGLTSIVTYNTRIDGDAPSIAGSLTTTNVEGCDLSVTPTAVTSVAALEMLTGDLTVTDACSDDASLSISSSDASSGTCPIIVTRTYTITDECNNSVQVTHIININDTTAPVVTGTTTASTVEGCATSDAPTAATDVAGIEALGTGLDIADACTSNANLSVIHSDASSGTCPIIVTRTYTITDECNNSVQVTHIININDTTAPVVTGTTTASTVEGCAASDAPTAATDVTSIEALGAGLDIADACTSNANLSVSHSDASSGTCPIVVTRTYTITDECNNSVQVIHTININDTTAPVVTGTTTASTVEGCATSDATSDAPTAATDVAGIEALGTGLDIADACKSNANLSVSHSDASSGTCPNFVT